MNGRLTGHKNLNVLVVKTALPAKHFRFGGKRLSKTQKYCKTLLYLGLEVSDMAEVGHISCEKELLQLLNALPFMQAIGAEGILPAECKAVVKEYVPEIMKAIVTLPADEVHHTASSIVGNHKQSAL